MPPPTAPNSWLAGRHFGIVIDAGSSGSRLQIYSWKDPRSIVLGKDDPLAYTLPKVEKGTQEGEEWVSKVQPGISSFADNPEGVVAHLQPLLSHARKHIPPALESETPLFLLATAGMRLLTPSQQADILRHTCRFLVLHSQFHIDGPSPAGPCGSSVRIITGEEEGLFGWIAVNYLMDGFIGPGQNRTTFGFLDMGGASTQIAFEPSPAHQRDTQNLMDVRLRLVGGEEIHHKVFVTTWLGYGTNQARERYVGKVIEDYEALRSNAHDDAVPDPCLPRDLELKESSIHETGTHSGKTHRLVGTGSFEQCMNKTAPLLNKNAPCPDTPCLMNGVQVPTIDFSVSQFIGVSEYWYSSEHIFGLGGAYNYVQYERAASAFCSRDWAGIMKQHEESRAQNRLGGDGEVEQDGKVVETGKWDPQVERSRLQMQCFKAAWISNVLHEGIKMPRLIDFEGNLTTDTDRVEKEAQSKGLGRPRFQSLDAVGDIAITWTLGKMVLEASKEVPFQSKTDRPLVDPIDDIPDPVNFPIKPIRPFIDLGSIEDRISPHLPTVLTRPSLGFSPVVFFLYVSFFCIVALLTYPLRRQIRALCLRSLRNIAKRDTDTYSMEEGKPGNGTGYSAGSLPPSPSSSAQRWLYPLRRIISSQRLASQPKVLSVVTANNPALRYINPSPTRMSPIRSYSNGSDATANSTQYATSGLISRSSSPGPDAGNGLSSLITSRSHNTSQINLSSIAPRQIAVSRTSSFQNSAEGSSQYDE